MPLNVHKPEETIDVSFAIASYNSSDYLDVAVRSALAQQDVNVEVIIVDDGSTDNSLALAKDMARSDKRVIVLQTPKNGGPSAARNMALKTMRGTWYAVLDSDDFLDPNRSARLIQQANAENFDLISDNLNVFGDGLVSETLINDLPKDDLNYIPLEVYFDNSCLFAKTPGFGFLKPMIRRQIIDAETLRYDETIRVGEDDELIVRLLAAGYKYGLSGYVGYQYRKHDGSISHRLSVEKAKKMLEIEKSIQSRIGPELTRSKAYQKRWRSIRRGLAFVSSVEALKRRQFLSAIKSLLATPSAIWLYHLPLKSFLKRLF